MPPQFLLMPGMDGTGELFDPLVRTIAASMPDCKIQVLRYPRQQQLNYEQLVEFAGTQLPNTGCVLIAESFSGPIAIALAARFPKLVESLVLSTSFVRNPLPWLTLIAPVIDFLPILHPPSWLMEQQLFNGNVTPELKLALARATESVSPTVMRARLKAVLNIDARTTLAQLSQPLLYLQADADRLVPERCGQEVKMTLASTSISRLAGPHCLLQFAPKEAWQEIQAWLKKTQK